MTVDGPLRPAAVAGHWYPDDPVRLGEEVDGYLAAVGPRPAITPGAIIAPHAGLAYSGPVAAHAYGALRGARYDLAVLVGPSHYVGFDGVSIVPRGAFATPFGPVRIDDGAAGRIASASTRIAERPEAHAREHSLELQLPFLCRLLPDTPIVPLVIGHQTRETIVELGDALVAGLAGTRALLVASTDLSHYFDRARALALDRRVMTHVERFDAEGLLAEFERYSEEERGRYVACGGGAAVAVMRAARGRGATRAHLLARGDSAEVSGDTSAVVGYLAAAFE